MKRQALGALALAMACASAGAERTAFAPEAFARHIKVLASDEYEGRAPASPGEEKTVAYIVRQFKAAGLKPGGDAIGDGGRAWTQRVPLRHFTFAGPVKVSVGAGGAREEWTQGEQLSLLPARTGVTRLTIADAPVVFAGYGVTAPERNWNDFKGYDVKGKIALVLVNDPDFETGVGDFGGKAMTYYGRWTYKFEEAARQGAVGFLVVHETAAAGYGWNTVKNSTEDVFDFVRARPEEAHAPLEGWIQRDAAAALMKKAGLDFDALKKVAQTREFKPVELPGVTLSVDVPLNVEQAVSHNVLGVVTGRRRPRETVLYTAHWDHLGVGRPDAKGDRIYNGAVDNASGVALLVELARAFGRSPRPDRSVVFMATTGEEKLFLGTDYYVANPLYPLETTAADLNMDGMNVRGRSRNVSAAGEIPLTLLDHMVRVAAKHGLAYSRESHPEYGSYFRNDHFPFARRGVPAITFGGGGDLEKGGNAASEAAYEAYKRDKYHQPADEYDPNWDLRGMVQEAEVFFDLGRELANTREWPEWKAGAEFKAIRDATQSQRAGR
ncbi:MAG TPA: M28 family peptidase [Ramlibacter sp.]|nr:M28 family peptidase [Ramlibacter sp.]